MRRLLSSLLLGALVSTACFAPARSEPAGPPQSPPAVEAASTSARVAIPRDDRLFVLCDSVLLGSSDELLRALGGWRTTMDCRVGRRLTQGLSILRDRRDEIGETVVIHMGNNFIADESGPFANQIERAMRLLRGVDRVIWVTVAEKWASRVTINRAIRAAARRWPSIEIAEWAPIIASHPEYSWDMQHLYDSGKAAIARVVAAKVGSPP